jgi:ribose 5-phosphate isomerase RpiB
VDASPELIKKITDAVLEVLNRNAGAASAPVSVHAPMGVCTGDYSKFPELAHLRNAAGPAANPALNGFVEDAAAAQQAAGARPVATPELAAVIPGPVLTGVITASKLAGFEGTIYLAAGAKLSPLAMDMVKQRGLTIQTIAAAPKAPVATAWVYWMQGHCPSAARVIEQLRGRAVADIRTSANRQLPEVIRAVSKEISGGKTRLAVLFVPAAARAVCLANRCANVRAIVGTCRQAVQEGIDLLGANVLVLEYPHHGFKSMAELISMFLTSSGRAPRDVEDQLTELAACR